MWLRMLSVGTVLGLALMAQSPSREDKKDSIRQRHLTDTVDAVAQPFEVLTARVLRNGNALGGVVSIENCKLLTPTMTVQFVAGTPLTESLDVLLSMAPKYRWDVTEDVLNVVPTGPAPPLLDMVVREFTWNNKSPLSGVIAQLSATSDIRKRIDELGLVQAFQGGIGHITLIDDPRPGLESTVKNEKLSSVLNAIIRTYDHGVWLYHERSCNGTTTFSLSAIVR